MPDAETIEEERMTWYAHVHARTYAEAKWPNLAPVTVPIALTTNEPGAPEPSALRQALFASTGLCRADPACVSH